MAFRKRNVGIGRTTAASSTPSEAQGGVASTKNELPEHIPGIRPSPLTGQATTSTGAYSLDSLLGGHAGLALGCSMFIEESGTTDFAGALLRYYAAEGITQGHTLHVVGVGEHWINDLPGLVGAAEAEREKEKKSKAEDSEKMKIAWRYERLGQVDSDRAGRVVPERAPANATSGPNASSASAAAQQSETPFCHTFDLTKRLAIPAGTAINHIPIQPNPSPSVSPFDSILQNLRQKLVSSSPSSIHRLVVPTVLSPALYPPQACNPQYFLRFLHSLRSLLRQYPSRLTAMLTLPLSLYSRHTGIVRWAETLSDGVIELTPFPHLMDATSELAQSGGTRAGVDEQPQGMLHIHKLPVTTDRGGGGLGAGVGDDLAFTISRRRFVIKPFSLPPMEGDTDAQQGNTEAPGSGALGKATKVDIEF